MTDSEIKELANQMIAIRSMMDRGNMKKIFQKMTQAEYVTMKKIFPKMNKECITEKMYLQSLTDLFDYSLQQASKLVQALQNKSYVYWEHDKKGTFIRLSEHGLEIMKEQQKLLIEYFTRVIHRIGKERFIEILEEMKEIELIMAEEAENFESVISIAE